MNQTIAFTLSVFSLSVIMICLLDKRWLKYNIGKDELLKFTQGLRTVNLSCEDNDMCDIIDNTDFGNISSGKLSNMCTYYNDLAEIGDFDRNIILKYILGDTGANIKSEIKKIGEDCTKMENAGTAGTIILSIAFVIFLLFPIFIVKIPKLSNFIGITGSIFIMLSVIVWRLMLPDGNATADIDVWIAVGYSISIFTFFVYNMLKQKINDY